MKRTLSDLITNSDTKDLVIKNVNIDSIKESPTPVSYTHLRAHET